MENKGLKILVVTIACLGILGLAFLATSKKKPIPKINKQVKTVSSSQDKTNAQASIAKNNSQQAAQQPIERDAKSASSQWEQCKNATMTAGTKLLWKVQITEAIPVGGTYAKGFLENDQTLPVHVVIKKDSQIIDKIKSMLAVGNEALLRGSCLQVANDGIVVLEAF